MLKTLARGMFLLFLAVMVVSWALNLGKADPAPPANGSATFYLVA
jgi:hypothetical protein